MTISFCQITMRSIEWKKLFEKKNAKYRLKISLLRSMYVAEIWQKLIDNNHRFRKIIDIWIFYCDNPRHTYPLYGFLKASIAEKLFEKQIIKNSRERSQKTTK